MTITDYKGEPLKGVIPLREGRSLCSINSYACLFRGIGRRKKLLLLLESLLTSEKHRGMNVHMVCEGRSLGLGGESECLVFKFM